MTQPRGHREPRPFRWALQLRALEFGITSLVQYWVKWFNTGPGGPEHMGAHRQDNRGTSGLGPSPSSLESPWPAFLGTTMSSSLPPAEPFCLSGSFHKSKTSGWFGHSKINS